MDLHAVFYAQISKTLAHRGMLDLIDGLDCFVLRVDNVMLVGKERRKITTGKIAVPVDGCGQNRTAMLLTPIGVICAAAKE